MINHVHLRSGMTRDVVNSKILQYIMLKDELFLGIDVKHNWKCKCGNEIIKTWRSIKDGAYLCDECKNIIRKCSYKNIVEENDKYQYIRSFIRGDILPNGDIVKYGSHVQVRHKYCGSSNIFRINKNKSFDVSCKHCCQKYENSFAHHIEVELGEPLGKYWDFERNTLNPYHIYKSSKNKVWIKCHNEEVNELNGLKKKDYHESYEIKCNDFITGNRCSSCNPRGNQKVHPLDSFGYKYFDKAQSWHPDNKISPFKVAPGSNKKYKFICPDCGYKFYKGIQKISSEDQWCSKCSMSKGEKKIATWLRYNGIEYEYEKEFDGLTGLGGGNLSYDFYLPDYNLLIEYQGRQHEGYIQGFQKVYCDYLNQVEHDERKRKYSKIHNIRLIEIWYYDFDNIEEILNKECSSTISQC